MAVRQRTMPPPQLDNSSSRNTSCSRRRRTVMSLCYSLVLLLLANLSSALAFQSSPVRVAPAIRQPYQQLKRQPHSKPLSTARYGRNNDYFEDDEDDDDFYEEDDQDYSRKRRRSRDDLGEFRKGRQSSGLNLPSSFGRRDGWRLPDALSKSLLAGVFVLGVGLGVTVDSQVNTNPKDLASRDAIDQAAPNPTLCAKLGASAMAFDQRVFVSFNPFNVYVSQADVKPACVLREANVVPILRAKNLINDEEVRAWYVKCCCCCHYLSFYFLLWWMFLF